MNKNPLSQLTIFELSCLADLPRFTSLRSWAAHHRLTAMAASRLIRTAEARLGHQLVHRSNRGISMTTEGESLARTAERLVQVIQQTQVVMEGATLKPYESYLTFGSRGFLNAALGGHIARIVEQSNGHLGARILDLSPEESADAAKAGCLDLCLSPEPLSLGRNWRCFSAGALVWKLYARRDHPLSRGTDVKGLRRFRVGQHSYWNGRQLINESGLIHEGLTGMVLGHGTQSAATALAVAAETDLVVCVPDHVAFAALREGRVAEIVVQGLSPVSVPLLLYVEQNRVKDKLVKALRAAIIGFSAQTQRR
jgi:DNA-binding transcriptional LysR family regulator